MKTKPITLEPLALSEDTLPHLEYKTEVSFILTMGGQFTARISLSPEGFIKAYNAARKEITLLDGNRSYFTIKKKYVTCYHVAPINENVSQNIKA